MRRAARAGVLLFAAWLAGCATPPPASPEQPPPPPPWPAPDAEPLARRARDPTAAELLAYQNFWCARERGARILRALELEAPGDALELLLLDWCDLAQPAPGALARRLAALRETRDWPEDCKAYFDWLQRQLELLSRVAAETALERQRLQRTVEQLRAIERDLSTRESDAETPP